jgi:CspA family cold shock protein
MIGRVGLSAEAAEARTLFDCHIWPWVHPDRSSRAFQCKEVLLLASGTVKWFNEENGYGYIVADGGGEELFVHRGSIMGDDWRHRTLLAGARVGFDLREGGIGPEAIRVLPMAAKGSP